MSGQEKKKDVSKKDQKKSLAASKGGAAVKTQVPIALDPPTGTRDFFPEEMRQQRYLFDKFREVATLYGFSEYDAPVLEFEELYKRKAGEEITQQMYNFVDKDDAKVTLRPEMTPSLARMVLNLMRAETGEFSVQLPLKWFSIPQCWRHETTQRGRKREHYQWNMDIVGEKGIMAEVELLSAVCSFFEKVGITSNDVGLKVNSRKVLGALMRNAGVPEDKFAETCVILDKQDKIGADAVSKEFQETVGLSAAVSKTILDATAATTLDEFARLAGVEGSDEVKELQQLFDLAADYGYGDWLQFDASVIRGLAYYTGVVFEGFDKAGVLRAICGGGRYDRLLSLYGSPKEVPCVGFGFGDCVIAELLKEKGVKPELPQTVDFVVAAFSADYMGKALSVARQLRLAGKSVDIFTEPGKKLAKAYNYADRIGARKLALVAPNEWDQGLVRVKDLRTEDSSNVSADDKQKDVPFADLANVDVYFGGAPAAVKANGAQSSAPGASSAPARKGPAAPASVGSELEAFLADHPYIGGYEPSARDGQLFADLQKASGRPATPNLARWYDHIESFPLFQRSGWS
jgi:histidyl-tRNA synthetase